MRLRCHDSFQVVTRLSPEEVRNTLGAFVCRDKKRYYQNDTMGKPFWGTVGMGHFRIGPAVSYRNSFCPVLTGTIRDRGDGTVLTVEMGLSGPVQVFLAVWLGVCGLFALTTAVSWPVRGFQPMDLAPFAMLLFGWGLTTFGYSLEADKAITRFCGLFPPI